MYIQCTYAAVIVKMLNRIQVQLTKKSKMLLLKRSKKESKAYKVQLSRKESKMQLLKKAYKVQLSRKVSKMQLPK